VGCPAAIRSDSRRVRLVRVPEYDLLKLLLTEKGGIHTLVSLIIAALLILSIPDIGLEKEHASGES
jgi:hypothetical protein